MTKGQEMNQPVTGDVMSAEEVALERRARRFTLFAMAVLLGVALLGVALAVGFVQREKEHDMLQWRIRLGVVADSRAQDVGRWVEDRFTTLRDLAQNASVQLYMTNLSLGIAENDADQVEGQYLRNLLDASAMQSGFAAQSAQLGANVAPVSDAGIALLDARGKVLAATAAMPFPIPGMDEAIRKAAQGGPALMDIRIGASARPVIGFAVPVFAVQGNAGAGEAIGYVIALRPLGADFFARLVQPGDTVAGAETLLLRAGQGQVEYLSPLGDGTGPLQRRLALNTPGLDAAFAIAHPGEFAELQDYRGRAVLAASRAVPDAPWVVLRAVDRDVALAGTDSRLTVVLVVSLALIAAVLAGTVALWKHGNALRSSRMALHYKVASDLFEGLLQFLRTLTDSQPAQVVCCDDQDIVTFANKSFAQAFGISVKQVKGKPLADVMGPARSRPIQEANRRVLDSGETESHVQSAEGGTGAALVQSFQQVRVPATRFQPAGVLTIITDITELTRARDRSEARLFQLVATLVGLVDRRDPFSAHHSDRTAEVAAAIAEEMALDGQGVATVRFTAQLMSLGKIVLPRELLIKTEPLTPEERAQIAGSYGLSAEIVEGVAFDGPVVDSIRQIAERWDGSGPAHLAGEAILPPARIVAVANAFVAMVSPRAYRDALGFEEACRALSGQVGTAFDRRPVSALINIVDNRGGPERWAHFARPQS